MLRVEAFKVRNDWARLPPDVEGGDGRGPAATTLVRQLRLDAVNTRVGNPFLVPRWYDRWWGE
jgi:hypothetical protein